MSVADIKPGVYSVRGRDWTVRVASLPIPGWPAAIVAETTLDNQAKVRLKQELSSGGVLQVDGVDVAMDVGDTVIHAIDGRPMPTDDAARVRRFIAAALAAIDLAVQAKASSVSAAREKARPRANAAEAERDLRVQKALDKLPR